MNQSIVRFEVLTAASMKMSVFWLLRRVVWYKFTDISEVLAAFIIRTISSDDGGSKHL
jgi:hypothetical protein